MAKNAEAEVIKQLLPDLVSAVSDIVPAVSDQCLAKGLISESTSRQMLELSVASEQRARTLVHSVHKSIKTESSCFPVFLEVLSETLPYRIKEKMVYELKQKLTDCSSVCKTVVPASQSQSSQPPATVPLESRLQCIQQQSFFLDRYESSVSRHASASTEKSLCEETLQSKLDEIQRLRATLNILSESDDDSLKDKELQSTKNRLLACEVEMTNLRGRIQELECIIEEESMRARRGRNTIRIETKRLFEEFARQSQDHFTTALKDKEQEYKHILAEKEAEIRQKMHEEMSLKLKDMEHKMALQEKELKIKELELNNAKMKKETKSNAKPKSASDFHVVERGMNLKC